MKSTLVALAVLMLTLAAAAQGHGALSADQLRDRVSFEPVAGASMPLNAAFTDERGRSLPLQGWLAARPTFLGLVYFDCDDLCSIVEQNLLSAQLQGVDDHLQQLQAVVTLYSSLGGGWN